MLLTKEVEVKVNSNTVKYYEQLGYEIPMKKASESTRKRYGKDFVYDFGKLILVKIEHLHKNSNVKVENLCDFCKDEIMNIRYTDYNEAIEKTGSCVCKKCSYIKKEQTEMLLYGKYYVQTDTFKQKRKNTCIEKFGTEHPLKNKSILKNVQKTNLKRYGHVSPSQVLEFKEKMKDTIFSRFGVENVMQNEEIKEKVRLTNLERYGVVCTMQLPEVRVKANETMCNNGTQKTSAQQLYIHSLYEGEINYPIKYYAADICFPDEKLIVEYSGGGHSLRVVLGRLTQEEFDRKELARHQVIKREGFNQMEILSKHDYLPSDEILLQMLDIARKYFSETNHSWINFDIDNSKMINAENKDTNGVFFDYGELRKIKKSA